MITGGSGVSLYPSHKTVGQDRTFIPGIIRLMTEEWLRDQPAICSTDLQYKGPNWTRTRQDQRRKKVCSPRPRVTPRSTDPVQARGTVGGPTLIHRTQLALMGECRLRREVCISVSISVCRVVCGLDKCIASIRMHSTDPHWILSRRHPERLRE